MHQQPMRNMGFPRLWSATRNSYDGIDNDREGQERYIMLFMRLLWPTAMKDNLKKVNTCVLYKAFYLYLLENPVLILHPQFLMVLGFYFCFRK